MQAEQKTPSQKGKNSSEKASGEKQASRDRTHRVGCSVTTRQQAGMSCMGWRTIWQGGENAEELSSKVSRCSRSAPIEGSGRGVTMPSEENGQMGVSLGANHDRWTPFNCCNIYFYIQKIFHIKYIWNEGKKYILVSSCELLAKKHFYVTLKFSLKLTSWLPVKSAEVEDFTTIQLLRSRWWVWESALQTLQQQCLWLLPTYQRHSRVPFAPHIRARGDVLERVLHFGRSSERRRRGVSLCVVLLLTVYIRARVLFLAVSRRLSEGASQSRRVQRG